MPRGNWLLVLSAGLEFVMTRLFDTQIPPFEDTAVAVYLVSLFALSEPAVTKSQSCQLKDVSDLLE